MVKIFTDFGFGVAFRDSEFDKMVIEGSLVTLKKKNGKDKEIELKNCFRIEDKEKKQWKNKGMVPKRDKEAEISTKDVLLGRMKRYEKSKAEAVGIKNLKSDPVANSANDVINSTCDESRLKATEDSIKVKPINGEVIAKVMWEQLKRLTGKSQGLEESFDRVLEQVKTFSTKSSEAIDIAKSTYDFAKEMARISAATQKMVTEGTMILTKDMKVLEMETDDKVRKLQDGFDVVLSKIEQLPLFLAGLDEGIQEEIEMYAEAVGKKCVDCRGPHSTKEITCTCEKIVCSLWCWLEHSHVNCFKEASKRKKRTFLSQFKEEEIAMIISRKIHIEL